MTPGPVCDNRQISENRFLGNRHFSRGSNMAFIKEDRGGKSFLRLEGPLTVYEVGEMREVLLVSMERDRELIVDIAGISDCDTAGVQLLISARKKTGNEKKKIFITGESEAVRKAAERIGVSMVSILGE